jgi:hypothetical protein
VKTLFSGGIDVVHATLLRDGRALLVAGAQAALFETLEPLAVPAPVQRRDGPAFVGTHDGNALLIGGSRNAALLETCERFDVSTATWSSASKMRTPRHYCAAVALEDRVLIMGRGPTESLRTGASRWEAEPLPSIDGDWLTAVTLSPRSVLVGSTVGTWVLTLEGDAWRMERGPARARATLVALNDGGALVCGGADAVQVDRLHPDGRWERLADLPENRCSSVGLQLDDGRVVLAGGAGMRDTTEDDSDGGQLDLEYRTVGEVHWVRRLMSLDDALVAPGPSAPWKRAYLSRKVDRGLRFGGGAVLVELWNAYWWDGL